jgi:hypothetical protein
MFRRPARDKVVARSKSSGMEDRPGSKSAQKGIIAGVHRVDISLELWSVLFRR